MKIKSIFTFIFLALILTNCGKETKDNKKEEPYKLTKKVQNTVDSLSVIKVVYLRGTIRFDNLLKVSSVKDLVYLTKNKNPYIRCYAFNGLSKNNYTKLKEIFFEHLKDTSVVQTRYECTGERLTVMNFMLNHFHPKNIGVENKFNEVDFKKYYKISETYKKNITPEKIIDYETEIKKMQNYDLLYYRQYYWSDVNDKDFDVVKKLIKKGNIEFKQYENMIFATAYFDINSCISYFPNIERRNDTIILKEQLYKKNPCDEKGRTINKVIFVISNDQVSKIKKIIVE
jgi:hypothetical protein